VLAVAALFTIILTASGLSSADAQQQQGTDNQDRNQTQTRDPSTHQNATLSSQQNQTQQQQSQGQGQQDRNQTRTRDPATHNQILQERWRNQTSVPAAETHRLHIGLNVPSVKPYVSNLNYTLTAEGTAVSMIDSSVTENASVTVQLSVWKSNNRIVAMDVLGGTVTIDDREETISAGSGYYLPHIKMLRVAGLVSYDTEDGMTYVKLLKIVSSVPLVQNPLPSSESDPAYTFDSSIFSRLDAEYYLQLTGEVTLSS
jgi:hypothetical protein